MGKIFMKIHIIGIAGSKTAPLAKLLSDQGHLVTGSDQQKIFPPISTILKKSNITINSVLIDKTIDLVIVGNVYNYFENTRQEFELVKKLNIPYISYTDYVTKYLIKPESILIAGSYGKTTITGLLSYIFSSLNLDPSYMFGGEPLDNFFPTRFGKSKWSIIEADENHNGLDKQTTFLYYPVKYLILTSAFWEHKDSFSNAKENLDAYANLIKKVPNNGLIIYNGHDPDIKKIIKLSSAKTIDYQTGKIFQSSLIGQYNQDNISAVFTLCQYLHLDESKVLNAIKQFPGIKRRLELLTTINNVYFYDDFAQASLRVITALKALHYSYPNHRLRVFFESRASFLQDKASISDFNQASSLCFDFILNQIQFSNDIDKKSRATAIDWQKEIGQKFQYIPINDQLINYFVNSLAPNDILIHFSSGGLDGLNTYNQIINNFKNKHV